MQKRVPDKHLQHKSPVISKEEGDGTLNCKSPVNKQEPNVIASKPVTPKIINEVKSRDTEEKTKELNLGDETNRYLEEIGIDRHRINRIISNYNRRQVRELQDKIMSTWPSYSEVREQYYKELSSTLDLNNFSYADFVKLALEFRSNFWSQGGELSANSYPNAYKSRVLLERAYERFSEDLNVIDELVETIQTTDLALKFDKAKNRNVRNEQLRQEILTLRSKQFELIQKQIQEGRPTTLQDFVSGCELAYILQVNNKPASKQIVKWLRDTDDGTWYQYDELLELWEKYLDRGIHYSFSIYDTNHADPDKYRYERRLPSFRGPASRNAVFWPQGENKIFSTEENLFQ